MGDATVDIITNSPPATTGLSLEVNPGARIVIDSGPTH